MILTKEVKDLYLENYNTLMKETEDNTNRWKDTLCSQTRGINIVKMNSQPKAIYRFNAILIKTNYLSFQNLYGNTEDTKQQKNKKIDQKKANLKGLNYLISNYTAKLQYSKQYSNSTNTDTQINREPRNEPIRVDNYSMTKEVIYTREKDSLNKQYQES